MVSNPYFPINTKKSGLDNFVDMIVKAGIISSKEDFVSLTEIREIEGSALPNAKGVLTYKVNGHLRKRNVTWTRSPVPPSVIFVKTLTAAEIDLAVMKSQIVESDIDYEIDLINRRIHVFAKPDSVVYTGETTFKVVASLYGQNKLIMLDKDDEIPTEPDPDESSCRPCSNKEKEIDPLKIYNVIKKVSDKLDHLSTDKDTQSSNTDEEELDPLAIYENQKALTSR